MWKKERVFMLLIVFFSPLLIPREISDHIQAKPEGRELEWFYDHLTSEDRKKIRQAMDYCIQREWIIKKLYRGHAMSIPSPIGVNFVGVYDNTVTARTYNTTKALTLLTEVFNKTYNNKTDNDTFTTEPYFKMSLIVPSSNRLSTSWGDMIDDWFNNIGIDVEIIFLNWNYILSRIFHDPVETGFDYAHGGFDALVMTWDMNVDPDLHRLYNKEYFPSILNDSLPNNYYWIENEEIEEIWDRALNSIKINDRIQALKDYQAWHKKNVPASIICQEKSYFGVNKNLGGFDFFLGYNIQNWTIQDQISATIIQDSPLYHYVNLNPLICNNYHTQVILDNIFCSLARRRGAYNLTHAVPWLAESYIPSTDYLTWDVKLREGIRWEDGTEVTADDVVFTYQMAMDKDVACPIKELLLNILGSSDNVKKIDSYNVKFTLPQFYPYVETVLFTLSILQKAEMSQVISKNWKTDDTNVKRSPMGCGAYKFNSSSPDTFFDTIIIEKNPYYNETKMGHNPNMVGGGNWLPTPTITTATFKCIADVSTTITGLNDGLYDVIGPYEILFFGDSNKVDEINASDLGKLIPTLGWSYEEIGYNQYSPIWGMNPHDPREMYPPEPWFPPSWFGRTLLFVIILSVVIIVIKKQKNV
ncbi:MAG: ABC transporter substrate-binding protein [Promethearchaeota archaeon]